jgi:hypothetical protein
MLEFAKQAARAPGDVIILFRLQQKYEGDHGIPMKYPTSWHASYQFYWLLERSYLGYE